MWHIAEQTIHVMTSFDRYCAMHSGRCSSRHKKYMLYFCITLLIIIIGLLPEQRGKIVEIKEWETSNPRSAVTVAWDLGTRNLYRAGFQGKVGCALVFSHSLRYLYWLYTFIYFILKIFTLGYNSVKKKVI